MDASSFEYLRKYAVDQFEKIIKQSHIQDIERYAKSMNRYYSKKTFNSEQEFVIDEITKAAYYDVFADSESKISEVWSKKLGMPTITQEVKDTIYDYAKKIAQAKTERVKNELYEEMAMKLAANIPSNLQEKITAWLRTSMLFNPTTLIRNTVNNIIAKPSYKMVDAMTNWLAHNMKDIPSDQQIAGANFKRFNPNDVVGKAVMDVTSDEDVRRVQAKSSKYSLAQFMGIEKKTFKTNWIQAISDATYGIMSVGQYKNIKIKAMGDIYMFQKYYREGIYNKLLAQGFNESMTAEQKADMIENAKEFAAIQATTRTWRMKNLLSNSLLKLQNFVEKQGSAGKLAARGMKIVTPFIITPAAITAESYKFSPIALAKALAIDYGLAKITGKWNRADATYKVNTVRKISQALVGTVTQFGVGMILSAFGLLTADWPEDKDEKAQWIAEGKRPWSLYITGVAYIPIDWAQPISSMLMAGAQSMETIANGDKSLFAKLASPITSSFNVVFRQSLLENISRQFGINMWEDPSTKLSELAQNGVLQAMPTIIKRFNGLIDPYARNVYSGSAIQIFFNRLLMGVPGGTFAVPMQIDAWGKPVKLTDSVGLGIAGRFFNNFISPFAVSPDKMDNVTREVTRVFNDTKNPGALPSVAPKTITRTKDNISKTWDVSGQDYIDLQKAIGQASHDKVLALISSATYKNKSDSEKAAALKKIYSDAVKKATDAYVKAHPKD